MVSVVLWFASGFAAWTLLEYVIHGPMSHRFRTFATPLHEVHHLNPHAVFTVGAWIPAATVILAALALFGLRPATIFILGTAAGFVAYEAVHYRIHFMRPRNRIETRLRLRHLAHHLSPNEIFGVTTSFWDRMFGTEPAPARIRELERVAAQVAPLDGPSNWKRALTMKIARRVDPRGPI